MPGVDASVLKSMSPDCPLASSMLQLIGVLPGGTTWIGCSLADHVV
jgi:hypothetical protein